MKKILPLIIILLCIAGAAPCGTPRQKAKPPVISPAGGCYGLNEPVTVGIRAEPDCSIIYTLDGSYPAEGRGTRVANNIASFTLPPGDTTVMAVAVRPGLPASSTARAVFTRSGGTR